MEPQSGKSSTRRLVIRVRLPSNRPPPAPVRPRWKSGALLLLLVVVAVGLSWLGIWMFTGEPKSVPAPPDVAPAVSNDPLPQPAAETAATRPTEVEPKVLEPPAAAPSPINEVIPNVSRSARETIRGTIRVSVRVVVGQDGTVLAATLDEPGPSRYFARLAVEASRKWTFAPQDSAEQRTTLVRFYFKRAGTTGRAEPLQVCKSC